LITKNGVPVAQLVPVKRVPDTLFGALRGSIQVTGDIVAPIDTDWEALS
jgi:antitoxin (DNA-binding transcriptional repressor) of toxin-antitoxin stability system